MVTTAARVGEVNDLLTAADVLLEASRAAAKLASIRSVSTRVYSLGERHVLELDSQRTIVFDSCTQHVAIFPDIQAAAEAYAPSELVFRHLVPALSARVLDHSVETRKQLPEVDKRFIVLLARGCCNKEIATRVGLAEATVKNRLSAIYARFGVQSRAEMITTATALGLLADSDAVFSSLASGIA